MIWECMDGLGRDRKGGIMSVEGRERLTVLGQKSASLSDLHQN